MKKLSILCTFMFVIGMVASSAFAQIIECTSNDECDDGISCNGEETCVAAICVEGVSPCAENEICDTENDICVPVDLTVSVDIKPGSCPNPLNVRSRGVLPVAILGTADFDVETINPETILITREGFDPVSPIRYSYDDVGAPSEGDLCDCDDLDEDDLDVDDIMDLTLKFRVPELADGLGLKEVESKEIIPLIIMGEAEDGTFMGEDCIRVINRLKWWQDKLKNPKKPRNRDEE